MQLEDAGNLVIIREEVVATAPSRQATTRLRCKVSPPRRTPQAWWVITSRL